MALVLAAVLLSRAAHACEVETLYDVSRDAGIIELTNILKRLRQE